jgi:hypothetical protein
MRQSAGWTISISNVGMRDNRVNILTLLGGTL